MKLLISASTLFFASTLFAEVCIIRTSSNSTSSVIEYCGGSKKTLSRYRTDAEGLSKYFSDKSRDGFKVTSSHSHVLINASGNSFTRTEYILQKD